MLPAATGPADIDSVAYLSLADRRRKELHPPCTHRVRPMPAPKVSRALIHQRRLASLLTSDAKPIDREFADLQAAEPGSLDRKLPDRKSADAQRTNGHRSNREAPTAPRLIAATRAATEVRRSVDRLLIIALQTFCSDWILAPFAGLARGWDRPWRKPIPRCTARPAQRAGDLPEALSPATHTQGFHGDFGRAICRRSPEASPSI